MLFIYIHGFNSSPKSFKAQCFSQYLSANHPLDEFHAPQLSDLPEQAILSLSYIIEQHLLPSKTISGSKIVLIGSSLGGFYATWLAQKYDLKAVLVNPAVNPQELLIDYLGKNTNYHTQDEYEFTPDHILQLDRITVQHIINPQKILVMLQTDDEVLDYHLAEVKYLNAHLMIEKGGDHSFQNFEQHCDGIYQFLNME